MRRRLEFAKKVIPHNRGDAGANDWGARPFASENDRGDFRFGSQQAEPRLGQEFDLPPVARAKHGMACHKIHAFRNVLGLHRSMSEGHSSSTILATPLSCFMTLAISVPVATFGRSLRETG